MFHKTLIGILAVAVVGISITINYASQSTEIVERHYSNYEQLRKVGEGEPGNWVPSFIPHMATEIKAKYKIDTGEILLTFHFKAVTDLSLADHCAMVTRSQVELPLPGMIKTLNVAWWPNSLSPERAGHNTLSQYDLFRCERETFLAVAKRADGNYQAFYWRIVK